MLEGQTVVAIIPAKGSSRRVPDKNMRQVGKETLLQRKIRQLKDSSIVDRIVVGSDSDIVEHISLSNGAEFLRRDSYFCDEERCSANEMIEDLVSRVSEDVVLWAHCTNPFVSAAEYDDALARYFGELGRDSLVSVTEIRSHIWTADERPFNFEPLRKPHQLASTLSPIYYQDGAIFIQPRKQMLENAYFYGEKPFLYKLEPSVSIDINTEFDLILVQSLLDAGWK